MHIFEKIKRWFRVIRLILALNKPMEPELFSAKMRAISVFAETDDEEIAHMQADALFIEVLRAYGYDKGCDIFENMPKWYA